MTKPVRRPRFLSCLIRLALMRMSLGTLGFERTRRLIRSRCEGVPVEDGDHGALVAAADRTIAMAAGFFPGRAACLEQSLVLYH